MGFAFFKVPQHRVFDYKPRFYDPEKERREQRRRELGLEDDDLNDDGEYKPGSIIRNSGMKVRHESFSQKMSKQKRQSRFFVLIFIVLLSFVVYYLLCKSPTFRSLISA